MPRWTNWTPPTPPATSLNPSYAACNSALCTLSSQPRFTTPFAFCRSTKDLTNAAAAACATQTSRESPNRASSKDGPVSLRACAVKTVGAGLLAKAACQSMNSYPTHRLRGQTRSHIGFPYRQVTCNPPPHSEEALLL